jgi:hypothetical protein
MWETDEYGKGRGFISYTTSCKVEKLKCGDTNMANTDLIRPLF